MLFLSFPSLILRQIRPSFCRCFSFLVILAMLFDLITSGRSLPLGPTNDRIFFSNALRNHNNILLLQFGTVPSPMSQFAETANKFVGLEKRRQKFGRIVGKKYDRNCFFSPVQCMLSFREGSNFMDNYK
ncbi:hypothetical protein niasHT_012555 [Heterodera trifolii]|uniref:Uncharacterized protein n=1 Tax=Heterodera trifolii TaxID=157864 RepID=A0ABD2L1I3_9BILA